MRANAANNEQAFGGHPSAFHLHPRRGISETIEFEGVAESVMRGELRLNEPMARHTSWRAGGCANRVYLPADLDDLAAFMRVLPPDGAVLMVGLGSNLLVRDGGLRGTVIVTHWALREIRPGNTTAAGGEICAQAGVPAPKVARLAALSDLAGAEFLAGIPGTMGGALAMNAGCYGGETWDIVARVQTIDRAGNIRSRTMADYEIGYRHVRLKAEGGRRKADGPDQLPPSPFLVPPLEEWFVSATLALRRGSGAESRAKITELLKRRIATQPLNQPNAGSVFRNPPGDHAARLIEACGLKGRAIGGARISAKHANFIVNAGNARAADIEALIVLAEQSVREKFGVALEREVRIVGEAIDERREGRAERGEERRT